MTPPPGGQDDTRPGVSIPTGARVSGEDALPSMTLISGRRRIMCSDPVYYARHDRRAAEAHTPSHLVAWPAGPDRLDEICYVLLAQEKVPVLVTPQTDGSVWLGGAYLDRIARELRLVPRPLPREMEEKSKEWLQAMGDLWQVPPGDPRRDAPPDELGAPPLPPRRRHQGAGLR